MKEIKRPQTSTVFEKLKNVPLSQLTQQDYNRLTSNVFIQKENLGFISDLSNVIRFQQKPRGLQECQAQQSGIVNSSTKVTILEIPAKKTYDIQAVTMFSINADGQFDYYISGISDGLDYLLKTVDYTAGDRGVTVDFSTMGDFLVSGTQTESTFIKVSRNSGSGAIAAHNVFFREMN